MFFEAKRDINRLFALFLGAHLLIWSLLPALFRYNLPMDALEGAIWGRHFALGYDKNPFVNGWLTGIAVHLGGTSGWLIYLFSQLSVVICFWAVFCLARKIVSPVYAFVSVFLLEFVANYNLDAIDFDDNILELSLWALLLLFFYSAVLKQRLRDWIWVGLFAGLSMMTKYYAVVLFVPMLIFLLLSPENRKSFRLPGLYVAVTICLLICAPHFIWLFSHNFVTIKYAFGRVGVSHFTWMDHFIHPYKFAMPYLEACIPPLLMFGILFLGKKHGEVISTPTQVSAYQWQFLWLLGVGPFVLTLLLSLVFGWILNSGWGQPLMSLWGILLVAAVQPVITYKRFYRLIGVGFTLLLLAGFAYSYSMVMAGDSSSAHYPGPKMAQRITRMWHSRYHTKLSYVVGRRWEAGAVSFYSDDQPQVYISANPEISFWIDEQALRKKGAIFVWDADRENVQKYQRFFPLKDIHVEKFYYYRAKKASPVRLGVGFLPPEKP